MRVLITGADSLVGRELIRHLLSVGKLRGQVIDVLLVLDKNLSGIEDDSRLRLHRGNITDTPYLRRALADGVDIVFHLDSFSELTAEDYYDLGYKVNLIASLELLNQLRAVHTPPVVIYASSVSVYGHDHRVRIDENASLRPSSSYGFHKLMIESALADLSRRGEIDGRALRLPGIVGWQNQSDDRRGDFVGDLIRAFANNEPISCPLSSEAKAWWMSMRCCVVNLIHAAELNGLESDSGRVWQLPVLHLSVQQVIDALAEHFGQDRRALINHVTDASFEAQFGSYPPLRAPSAKAAGFISDGSAAALIRNSLCSSPASFRKKRSARETV